MIRRRTGGRGSGRCLGIVDTLCAAMVKEGNLWGDGLEPVSVVLADDHRIVRKGLEAVLKREDGIDVVAEAEDGREAVETCQRLEPDLVLLDVSMPGMNGLLATDAILKSSPKTKVLILSMHLDETYIAEALSRGASGYVLKDCATSDLVNAIKSVIRGETYLSPKVATLVVKKYINTKEGVGETVFDVLSSRELEVLQLLAEGKTTKSISEILVLSPKTIDSHRANISRKLDLHDVPSLVKFAIRTGITEL